MRLIPPNASIFLVLAACTLQAICQECHSYSARDDLEAARAYSSRSGSNQKAAAYFKEAADLIAKQKFFQARALLEEVTKLDPGCAAAYSSYAYCQTWLEQYIDATHALAKAIGIDSGKPIFFYRKALCYFSTGQMDDAVNELNHAIGIAPTDADCLRLRARCLKRIAGGANRSIEDYGRLIKNNSYTVEALCQRGILYDQIGDNEKALQDFDAAIKIKPDSGEAYVGRANIFYKQQNYRIAADNYSAAL